jgi:DNA-binding CsgD family transcriptional regulator
LTVRALSRVSAAGPTAPRTPHLAAADIDESYRLAEEVADHRGVARSAAAGAVIAFRARDVARAAALYRRCFDVAVARGYWRYVTWSAMGAIVLAAHHGRFAEGARILGAMLPTLDVIRNHTPAPMTAEFDGATDLLHDRLGENFDAVSRTGEQEGWAAALDTVRELLTSMACDPASAGQEREERRVARDDSRLTKREREVLRLLAGGSSNQQIADELVISPKTVMHHTSALYRKLAVRGRAEAVAHAIRRGLVAR